MTRYKNAFLGLIAVFLCSCGFGNLEQASGLKEVQTAFQARSKEATPPVDPRAVLTREAIDNAGIPLILVDIPLRQQSGTMTRLQASTNGEHWIGADGSSLRFVNGSLVESRGMGHDLIKATPAMLSGESKVIHTRRWQYLDGFNQEIVVSLECNVESFGKQIIDNIGKQYNSRLFTETCVSKNHSFVNKYWITQDGVVSKSVQWHGPDVGFMTISRLF